jgi:hypothetical protein
MATAASNAALQEDSIHTGITALTLCSAEC